MRQAGADTGESLLMVRRSTRHKDLTVNSD